jgi:hypothetical protein
MITFYSKERGEIFEELLSSIEDSLPSENLKICTNTLELSKEICRPGSRKSIVILLVSSEDDFTDILSLREQLWDVKIILIMYSNHPDTILQGHLLNPRFLSSCDSNYREAVSVLKRMIDNTSAGKPAPK